MMRLTCLTLHIKYIWHESTRMWYYLSVFNKYCLNSVVYIFPFFGYSFFLSDFSYLSFNWSIGYWTKYMNHRFSLFILLCGIWNQFTWKLWIVILCPYHKMELEVFQFFPPNPTLPYIRIWFSSLNQQLFRINYSSVPCTLLRFLGAPQVCFRRVNTE